ncbi:hypothetical protein BGZ82_008048, partial [Podila clonocystis]
MDAEESFSTTLSTAVQEGARPSTMIIFLPPELLHSVFGYISRDDLNKCVHICKCWSHIGIPLVWKVLDTKAYFFFIYMSSDHAQVKLRMLEIHHERSDETLQHGYV